MVVIGLRPPQSKPPVPPPRDRAADGTCITFRVGAMVGATKISVGAYIRLGGAETSTSRETILGSDKGGALGLLAVCCLRVGLRVPA